MNHSKLFTFKNEPINQFNKINTSFYERQKKSDCSMERQMSNLSCFKKDIFTVKIKFEAPTDFTELANLMFQRRAKFIIADSLQKRLDER